MGTSLRVPSKVRPSAPLTAYGALVVHVSFQLRKRLGARAWRRLHYLSFAVFLGALLHGVLAGSDSASLGMRVTYAGAGGAVLLLTTLRVVGALRKPRRARHDRVTG